MEKNVFETKNCAQFLRVTQKDKRCNHEEMLRGPTVGVGWDRLPWVQTSHFI